MLIVALVLAVVALAALVAAVVTSNELIAWVCIAASVLGVILLIIDAIRERQHRDRARAGAQPEPEQQVATVVTAEDTYQNFDADFPEDALDVPDQVAEDWVDEAEAIVDAGDQPAEEVQPADEDQPADGEAGRADTP